ncbi:MAG TPA: ABC transporter substrate-binding protein [Thermoplasmata archaeon]|nr:ABC transporter substrate-binding protein [Thermoplasmata archaeon]
MDPKRRNILIVGIVVILVAAGIGGYFLLKKVQPTCRSGQTKTICIDQAEIPDSLDPGSTFSTPGWAAVQQVYQGLVNYNGSSDTSFVGVLATNNGTVGTNPLTGLADYTFDLRPGVHFSNGDPYNAYVQWYSFYRSLLLEQGPQFILEENFYSTNFDPASPLTYYSDPTAISEANASLVSDLNSWNFSAPDSAAKADMEMANQSFQVIDNLTIQLNLGFGYLASNYSYLLASISAPNSYAVDPIWIDHHGGIVEGAPNGYLSTHTLGTGQYTLSGYDPNSGGGYTLNVNANYWGKKAATQQPWNTMIRPANTTVVVVFQSTLDVTVSDLQHGIAQSASFAYIGPSTIAQLQTYSNLHVTALPTVYGSTSGAWWVYLNQSEAPFDNLSVREAVAHAINYTQIIDQAFGGYATQWVGPVPPAYPYYNPANLTPYAYDLSLARAEIADSPCAADACRGDSINYEYLTPGADWAETAQFLATDLAAIGLTINPVPITLPDLYVEQSYTGGVCTTSTATNGGPFPMGQEFYTSDYISPDDWTQNDAVHDGSANLCMSGYNNATVNNLTYAAAASSNPAVLSADYTNMTSLMYDNYTDIWLVAPASFAVYATDLHGMVFNPMASAEPYATLFNTDWIS